MIFSSPIFLFYFLPACFLVYFSVRRFAATKNIVLLLFSLFFYLWGEKAGILILLFCIVFNYGCGLLIQRWRDCLILTLGIVGNVALLAVFNMPISSSRI